MTTTPIVRAKGTVDLLPSEFATRETLRAALVATFERAGYLPFETPIIEHSDLYLRKSGEEIVSRMYDFTHRNRRLALRPEVTASAVRAYIEHFQEQPLPVRLYYSGPVFRYETPQKSRYRQFTQVGLELIGASSVRADAEIIKVAADGLEGLGLSDYHLIVGHLGILSGFLQSLGIRGQLRTFLLFNMEALRKEGIEAVVDKLADLAPGFRDVWDAPASPGNGAEDEHGETLIEVLKHMSDDNARSAVLDFLDSLNIRIDSNRSETEIVDRLLNKLKQEQQLPKLRQALAFMHELSALHGEVTEVLAAARALLEKYEGDTAIIDEIQTLFDLIEQYGLAGRCSLDLGLSRGLHYYTGMLFEIYHDTDENSASLELCGGGRCDDLVNTLGGTSEVATTGFAYGLERIRDVLQESGRLEQAMPQAAQVLVISVDDDDYAAAIGAVNALRVAGVRTEIDVRGRGVRRNFDYANKRGIPYVVVIGAREREAGEILLHNMQTGEETSLALTDDLARQIDNVEWNTDA